MIERKCDTPDSAEFWKSVNKSAKEVAGWPEWKRGVPLLDAEVHTKSKKNNRVFDIQVNIVQDSVSEMYRAEIKIGGSMHYELKNNSSCIVCGPWRKERIQSEADVVDLLNNLESTSTGLRNIFTENT